MPKKPRPQTGVAPSPGGRWYGWYYDGEKVVSTPPRKSRQAAWDDARYQRMQHENEETPDAPWEG